MLHALTRDLLLPLFALFFHAINHCCWDSQDESTLGHLLHIATLEIMAHHPQLNMFERLSLPSLSEDWPCVTHSPSNGAHALRGVVESQSRAQAL
jgi:hypothetical protein